MLEDRPFLVWSGRIEQEGFLKKKKTLGGTLENSPAATAPVFSPSSCLPGTPSGLWGVWSPDPKHGGGESAHLGGPETTVTDQGQCDSERRETKGTRESANQGRPRVLTPIAWRRVSA